MQRWDIINHLVKKNKYQSYLEVGYYKGWSFDRIQCYAKTAVDPNPSKTPEQEKSQHGNILVEQYEYIPGFPRAIQVWIEKLTSDEFFAKIDPKRKWDIIFIDGLHESSQVDRDIQNALKHLNPGGTIVMHDCNPSTEEMTTTGTANGEWTGDVYKSFIDFKYNPEYENKNRQRMYSCYVVDTDYGVGIIRKVDDFMWSLSRMSPEPDYIINKEYYSFPIFQQHKANLLHLVTPEDFLFIEKINHE